MHAPVTPLCACVHMCPAAKGKSFLSCCLCLCPCKTYKVVLPLPSTLVILKPEHWVMFGHRTWRKHETTGKSKGGQGGQEELSYKEKLTGLGLFVLKEKSLEWGRWWSHKSWWKGRRMVCSLYWCEAGLEVMNLNCQKNQFRLDVS